MTTLEVTLTLPDKLVEEARAEGLLTAEELTRIVREALRAKRIERLGKARAGLAANPIPPMNPEEIQAEIDACRAEQPRAAGA
ncbi:MAG: hypothetical protein ACKVQU_19695 [Burkholderiales bacterium]